MKHIIFITTGGTIASQASEEGLVPALTSDDLLKYLSIDEKETKISCEDLMKIDSSNMQPEEWCEIAKRITQLVGKVDGIVLTHGTDTMAYTASALSFMLCNIPIPVIITGSQLPLLHPLSDGLDNLRLAFEAASSDIQGIYVAFNRKLILGTRAVKVRTMSFDAFESVNQIPVGIVDARGLRLQKHLLIKAEGAFKPEIDLCRDVMLLKLIPGMNPEIFDMLSHMKYRGIVIEAFGAGGINFIRRDLIAKLEMAVEAGISVVVCSQCLYEHSNLSIYQPGQKALRHGVIQGYDMTSEACVAKLMWALKKSDTMDGIREIFAHNYVNEIVLSQE